METYKYLSKLWGPSTSSSASSSPASVAARTLPTPPPTPPPQLPPDTVTSAIHQDEVNESRPILDLTKDDHDDSKTGTGSQIPTGDPDAGAEGDMLDVKTPPQPGDTLYLSARRRPRTSGADAGPGDARTHFTISQGVPPHLEGAVRAELQRKASQGKGKGRPTDSDNGEREQPPELEGNGPAESWEDTESAPILRPVSKGQTLDDVDDEKSVLHEGTDAEAERLLTIKQKRYQRQQRRRCQLSRTWPVRLSVSVYVLLRHLLSWLGIPYSPRSPHNALLAPPPYAELKTDPHTNSMTIDNDSTSPDELVASLQKSEQQLTEQPPTPTRSSLFSRRSNPPSQTPSPALRPTPTPPRLTPKVLVLDLDETLIHSTSRPYASSKKNQGLKVRVVEVVLDGRSTVYTVYKRPWVDFFLRKVSTWYTVIIFTASLPEYADPVIDWLDGGDGGGGMVGGRLFRSDCVNANGSYVKDLSVVDSDLSRVCLVDNSPVSYAINQANGIPIEGWINDPNDECLLDLLPMLDSLRFTSDVRRVLGLRGFGR